MYPNKTIKKINLAFKIIKIIFNNTSIFNIHFN